MRTQLKLLAKTWLVAASALFAVGQASAAAFLVELGTVRVALDAPAGFADTGFTGSPRLRELAEKVTSASNRILLFAITDADLRSFTRGDRPEFRRYLLVVTPRSLEREWVSGSQFRTFAEDSLRALGKPAPDANYQKHLDAQPFGQPTLLAELRKEREIVSVLVGVRLPPKKKDDDEKSQYVLSTTSLLWLRGKALSFSVHTAYEGQADADWIVYTERRWIDDIKGLNSR